MKILKSLSLLLLLASCKNFAATSANKNDSTRVVVATYSGGEVTRQDLDSELVKLVAKNEKLKNLTFDNLSAEQKEGLIKEIVVKEVFYKEAKKRGLDKDADYQKALKIFESDLLQQKLLIALVTEARSDENVRKNYDELTEKMKGKKDFKISYIALKTKSDANSLYQSLNKSPSSFAAEAKKKSIDKETGKKGGSLGFVIEDSLSPELVKEIKALTKGQISKPISTAGKWVLIRLEGERAAEFLSYEKAKDSLAQNLAKKAVDDFVSQSLAAAKINMTIK